MLKFRRFSAKQKTGILLGIFLFISLLLLSFSGRKISFKPKEIGLSFVSVFQNAFSEVGDFFARTVRSVNELNKLQSEYENLLDQLKTYKTLERDLVELREENNRLREQLHFSSRLAIQHEPAEIIAKDPSNLFNTIIINKGSRHGIERDMPVIAYQDGFHGLMGKIVNVGILSSEVLPLYDRSCSVAARLQESRYEGLITGQGNNSSYIQMSYVKKRARSEIKYGDLIITSGLSRIYPQGIYIGRVRSIAAKEYESTLTIDIEPIIDFTKIEHVFVLKSDE
jgi:rod shape-determining protein MreC